MKAWICDQLRWSALLLLVAGVVALALYASRPPKDPVCYACRFIARQFGRALPEGAACGPEERDHYYDNYMELYEYRSANHLSFTFDDLE